MEENGATNKVTIKQLHTIYLEMMQSFHRYCVTNGITYYMVGGTLLGAVRNKGFIPWDDDVDLAMPRNDYEKFVREYDGELLLHSINNCNEHFFPYLKLFHPETPVIQVDDSIFDICSKVFIQLDIYPIDGLGNNAKKALRQLKRVKNKKKLLYLNLTEDKSKNPIKSILLFVIRAFPAQRILQSIEKLMKKHTIEESTYVTRWREGGTNTNCVKKEIFGTPMLMPFENLEFFAPQDSCIYLENVYGDYLVEKREEAGVRHDVNNNCITLKLESQLTDNKSF